MGDVATFRCTHGPPLVTAAHGLACISQAACISRVIGVPLPLGHWWAWLFDIRAVPLGATCATMAHVFLSAGTTHGTTQPYEHMGLECRRKKKPAAGNV